MAKDTENEGTPENEAPGNGAATEAPADATGSTPESEPEGPKDESGKADERDAEIAALKQQLADAAPILQAHRDAEEANKSELQKANDKAASLESELSKLRDEAARARVAEQTGLGSDIVALLNGSTEDELMAAAQKVAGSRSSLRTQSHPTVGAGASTGGDSRDEVDPAKLAEAIRKRLPY